MSDEDVILLDAIKCALLNENTKLWKRNGTYHITIMGYKSSETHELLEWYETI